MLQRILAMFLKEFRQIRRDPPTIGMMIGLPFFQLLLFGYAINGDPRHMPMAIELSDNSAQTRSIVAALSNSSFFEIRHVLNREGEGEMMLKKGEVQFVAIIPPDFTRNLVRGTRPQMLVIADATDPSATSGALGAVSEAVNRGLSHDLPGPLSARTQPLPPVDLILQRSYNPEGITSHNIVPGLLAIILSMTMVMMTAMAVTRETERGTLENLLAMPLRPFEVMAGKIAPYLLAGFVQTAIILTTASLLFQVPFTGSITLMIGSTLLFITLSLALGYTISTIAQTQLQAMQLSFFYVLPSILLSGFFFPYSGMPRWAQWLAELVPVTHFLRVIRGVMLKGWELSAAIHELTVMAGMLVFLGSVAVFRYRDTVA